MENIELETQGEYSSEDNNTSLDDVQQPNKSVNSVCTVNKNKVRKKYEYIFRRGAKSKMRLEHKGNNSHFKFTSYSNIEGIKCTVGNHNPIIDSQYILSSNIYAYFDFAFCKTCLEDLLYVILDSYQDDGVLLLREGCIKLCTEEVEGICLVCGSTKSKYEISLGNKTFVMCQKCYNRFCEYIMFSDLVKELFPTEYNKFKNTYDEITLNQSTQRIISRLFPIKEEHQLTSFVKKRSDTKIEEFTFIPVNNIRCNFCVDKSILKAKVILGTDKKNNNLSLAYCTDCASEILDLLKKSVYAKRSLSNKTKHIKCAYAKEFEQSQHCFLCGRKKGNAFHITHGNCDFTLCESCCKKYIKQLQKIKKAEFVE